MTHRQVGEPVGGSALCSLWRRARTKGGFFFFFSFPEVSGKRGVWVGIFETPGNLDITTVWRPAPTGVKPGAAPIRGAETKFKPGRSGGDKIIARCLQESATLKKNYQMDRPRAYDSPISQFDRRRRRKKLVLLWKNGTKPANLIA